MSVNRTRSTRNTKGHRFSGPTGLHQRPGRSGAGWAECRRVAIRRAGGICQGCGRPLNPAAPKGSDWSTEVDHFPVPLRLMEKDYEAGRISLAEFNRRANDPNGCRALHKRCHIDRDLVPGSASSMAPEAPRTREEWD